MGANGIGATGFVLGSVRFGVDVKVSRLGEVLRLGQMGLGRQVLC